MLNKKLNFWRLAIIFAGITAITLMLLWSFPQEPQAQMMDTSMGNMMKGMQDKNLTIYDLFDAPEAQSEQSQAGHGGDTLSHHQNQSVMVSLNFLSTAIIFLLLPLIIGGAIMLAIAWIR